MCLGELVFPDTISHRDFRKVLPSDCFFEGNTIVVKKLTNAPDPLPFFHAYISSHDRLLPFHPHLWHHANGSVPTRWFLRYLHRFFPKSIAGQSMRAGGATALALAGVQPNIIQGIGQWALSAFQIYIRKNPVLLQAFLFNHPPSHNPL